MEASQQETVERVLSLAYSAGATLAGISNISDIKRAALERSYPVGEDWLQQSKSVLVLALFHPVNKLEMDWWGTENGTVGNDLLKMICEKLKNSLGKELNITVRVLKYQPGAMGLFLKDAAVLAGLGCIGANNLLLTEQYGAHIRLHGLLLDVDLPGNRISHFSPCPTCAHPCWKACPQAAFESGSYNRLNCRAQMRKDELNRKAIETDQWGWVTFVKYCRACELACPIGKTSTELAE